MMSTAANNGHKMNLNLFEYTGRDYITKENENGKRLAMAEEQWRWMVVATEVDMNFPK